MKDLRTRILRNRNTEGDDDRLRELRDRMKKANRERRAFDRAAAATGGGHDANTLAPPQDFNPDQGQT